MNVYLYTLAKTLYEGEAKVVVLPTETGEISVLSNHSPLVTNLSKGRILIKNKEEEKSFNIEGGFVHINQNTLIILSK